MCLLYILLNDIISLVKLVILKACSIFKWFPAKLAENNSVFYAVKWIILFGFIFYIIIYYSSYALSVAVHTEMACAVALDRHFTDARPSIMLSVVLCYLLVFYGGLQVATNLSFCCVGCVGCVSVVVVVVCWVLCV